MFDKQTDLLASYAASSRYEDLSAGEVAAIVRHYFDVIACGLGGMDAAPCKIARDVAKESAVECGCSVLGLADRVVPEFAVFANVSAVRQLDYNDSYTAPGGGHPSDMLPAMIAAGELVNASGKQLILGAHVGYEVFGGLGETYALRTEGWDQVFIALAVAAGAGVIMGLDRDQIANAISLSLTPNMPLRSTRAGQLSYWKGCATADLAFNALFAVRLAQRGMTGPGAPFEEVNGFHTHVPPIKDLVIAPNTEGLSVIERTSFKFFPAEYNSQALISAIISARDKFRLEDVKDISIDTWFRAWHEIGGGQNDHDVKWDPKNRETADHSLAYILAVALVDGDITVDSFSPERIQDRALRPVMNKISISPRDDLTDMWPAAPRSEITVTLNDGNVIEFAADYSVGHYKNPMNDEQLSQKFQRMASRSFDSDVSSKLETTLWNLADLPDTEQLTSQFRALLPMD